MYAHVLTEQINRERDVLTVENNDILFAIRNLPTFDKLFKDWMVYNSDIILLFSYFLFFFWGISECITVIF